MYEWIMERFTLARERVVEIAGEQETQELFQDFFQKTAAFLIRTSEILTRDTQEQSLEEAEQENRELFQELFPENYDRCYGNPAYCGEKLGEYGPAFTFLYAELRGTIPFAFEKRWWDFTVCMELFLEVYAAFENREMPSVRTVKEILRSYVNDYCQDMVGERIREGIDPEKDFAAKIIMESDLTDLRYLYQYGEYVSDNERKMAEFLNTLSQEQINEMARTYTEGYRIGFLVTKKDLSKKKTVNIRYRLGFERMVRAAILQFADMGLSPVIYRHGVHAVNKKSQAWIGFEGAMPNPQYEYDHRQDCALFLDGDFVQRKLRAMQIAYEKYEELAAVHGGPAVIETFGEVPFAPETKAMAWTLSEAQQKLLVEMDNEAGQIVNRYIKGEERSFTIIAYPIPEIGEKFPEIFEEIVKINNLDYEKYQKIQQSIIDTLDTCQWVEIKGQNGNETDLLIHLHTLEDPKSQTNFENCVADVNIPVGEVFTSPVLAGTGGVLHVSKVYLNGLQFRDLKLVFDCGQVIDYSCSNFESEEENRRYIEDNILFHHEKLPMGEFAIGTNTTAYVAAQKYDITDQLPILIAEKMGPHFAVGDTCYSWAEDTAVFNPDGKEIIARDNEISILRKEDMSLAYYGCHTDITIPYEELESICVIDEEGEKTSIIEKGRFVLPGTEALNEPFGRQNL